MPNIKIEFIDGNMYSHDLDTGSITPIYAAIPTPGAHPGILRVASSVNTIVQDDQFSETVVNTIETMQSPSFLEKFKLENPDNPSELVSEQMQNSKLSLGLLQTLQLLNNVAINIMVDDSGSMDTASDIPLSEMHPEFLRKYNELKAQENQMGSTRHKISNCLSKDGRVLTRWGEASNQLYTYIDNLFCVPTGTITIRYFNRRSIITITPEDRKNHTVSALKQKIYQALWKEITADSFGSTPTYALLKSAFNTSLDETMHVLITDGTPTDCDEDKSEIINGRSVPIYSSLIELVRTRGLNYGLPSQRVELATNSQWKKFISPEKLTAIQAKSKANPLMLLSCTKEELTYFDTLDQDSECVDAMDDFPNEAKQVRLAHGVEFPYTKEVWVLKQLVGAKSRLLDALDEKSKLFTKEAYELFTGYKITESVYARYVTFKLSINAGAELIYVAPDGVESKYQAPIKPDFTADSQPKSAATMAPSMAFMPSSLPENRAVETNGCGCVMS